MTVLDSSAMIRLESDSNRLILMFIILFSAKECTNCSYLEGHILIRHFSNLVGHP